MAGIKNCTGNHPRIKVAAWPTSRELTSKRPELSQIYDAIQIV
jgi:hypothetical protein